MILIALWFLYGWIMTLYESHDRTVSMIELGTGVTILFLTLGYFFIDLFDYPLITNLFGRLIILPKRYTLGIQLRNGSRMIEIPLGNKKEGEKIQRILGLDERERLK